MSVAPRTLALLVGLSLPVSSMPVEFASLHERPVLQAVFHQEALAVPAAVRWSAPFQVTACVTLISTVGQSVRAVPARAVRSLNRRLREVFVAPIREADDFTPMWSDFLAGRHQSLRRQIRHFLTDHQATQKAERRRAVFRILRTMGYLNRLFAPFSPVDKIVKLGNQLSHGWHNAFHPAEVLAKQSPLLFRLQIPFRVWDPVQNEGGIVTDRSPRTITVRYAQKMRTYYVDRDLPDLEVMGVDEINGVSADPVKPPENKFKVATSEGAAWESRSAKVAGPSVTVSKEEFRVALSVLVPMRHLSSWDTYQAMTDPPEELRARIRIVIEELLGLLNDRRATVERFERWMNPSDAHALFTYRKRHSRFKDPIDVRLGLAVGRFDRSTDFMRSFWSKFWTAWAGAPANEKKKVQGLDKVAKRKVLEKRPPTTQSNEPPAKNYRQGRRQNAQQLLTRAVSELLEEASKVKKPLRKKDELVAKATSGLQVPEEGRLFLHDVLQAAVRRFEKAKIEKGNLVFFLGTQEFGVVESTPLGNQVVVQLGPKRKLVLARSFLMLASHKKPDRYDRQVSGIYLFREAVPPSSPLHVDATDPRSALFSNNGSVRAQTVGSRGPGRELMTMNSTYDRYAEWLSFGVLGRWVIEVLLAPGAELQILHRIVLHQKVGNDSEIARISQEFLQDHDPLGSGWDFEGGKKWLQWITDGALSAGGWFAYSKRWSVVAEKSALYILHAWSNGTSIGRPFVRRALGQST